MEEEKKKGTFSDKIRLTLASQTKLIMARQLTLKNAVEIAKQLEVVSLP